MPPAPPSETAAARNLDRRCWVLIAFFALGLFAIRLAGPDNLTDNDQERPASYVLDAVQNGHWAIQRDAYDDVASKPPLYTWLAAGLSLVLGRADRFALYLPCALAVAGMAALVFAAARARFGVVAGLLGAVSILFCQFGYKTIALARTDALFAFTVTLAALAAWRAWTCGRGWTWFWLAAAAATLAKGPLGLLLAGGGLLAALWERRAETGPTLRGGRWPGMLLWLGIAGGWFAWAYLEDGTALVRKQIGGELAGHLTGSTIGGKYPGYMPHFPALYFLSRYAPWSLAVCVAFWRVLRRPASDPTERRFERFLFCWFALGLLVFTIAPHKRADLLLPLVPAAAILAGREIARWLTRVSPVVIWRATAIAGSVLLGILALAGRKFEPAPKQAVPRELRAFAGWLQSNLPPDLPLTFEGENLSLELYLNRHQLVVWPAAAAVLIQGDAACYIATRNLPAIRAQLPPGREVFVLHSGAGAGPLVPQLVSNRRSLADAGGVTAVGVGPLRAELSGVALVEARRTTLVLRPLRAGGGVTLHNASAAPVTAGVAWVGLPAAPAPQSRVLAPGESWTVPSP